LRDDRRNGNVGISEEEELVDTSDDDGPEKTQEPHSWSVDRHGRIVYVGDGSSDFRIRRVLLDIAANAQTKVSSLIRCDINRVTGTHSEARSPFSILPSLGRFPS
jgi:hypothetical protein